MVEVVLRSSSVGEHAVEKVVERRRETALFLHSENVLEDAEFYDLAVIRRAVYGNAGASVDVVRHFLCGQTLGVEDEALRAVDLRRAAVRRGVVLRSELVRLFNVVPEEHLNLVCVGLEALRLDCVEYVYRIGVGYVVCRNLERGCLTRAAVARGYSDNKHYTQRTVDRKYEYQRSF